MPSLFIGPTGQYINTAGPMSQTHRIDGKTHIFFKKITEEEARKRVAEKRAKETARKRETAIAGLRKVEDETKARNTKREEEARKRVAEKKPKVKEALKKTDIIEELKKVVAETVEASKEGGRFKRRENWKGKAGYFKKINALWNDYKGGADTFKGVVYPSLLEWNPPKDKNENSHAYNMYVKHGINID